SFEEVSGWRRIIDFKQRSTDTGLYNLSGSIAFYPYTTGSGLFTPGGMVNIVVTRDDATDVFAVYANGANVLTLNDTAGDAVFSTTGKVANFFRDDIPVPNEASAGFVDKIRFYDGALSATQVRCLQTGDPQAGGLSVNNVPAPGSLALVGLAFAGLGLARRRRA
ncbi:MAG: hypothetical protein RLZZ598_1270, partial [Pseudomonadota bacterium]